MIVFVHEDAHKKLKNMPPTPKTLARRHSPQHQQRRSQMQDHDSPFFAYIVHDGVCSLVRHYSIAF